MIIRELFTRMGLKVDDKSFKKADKKVEGTASQLKKLAGLLVGGVVARGIANFISSQINLGDNIGKTAVQIGVGVEALQELRFAADLAGVEAAQFDQSLALLQKNAAEARDGVATFKDEFDRLGISVTDSSGRLKDGAVLLSEVADGINGLDEDAQKTATSLALMGRTGRKLLPLFLKGAAGIEEMRQEARDLGFILGEEDVKASELARDELTRFGRVVRGMKNRVFLAVLPSIISFVGGLIKMGRQFNETLKGTRLVEAGLLVLGALAAAAAIKLAVAFAPALLTFVGIALAVTAIVLIVEDLLTLFAGGTSVVGLFLDEVFGIGTAAAFVENFRTGIELMTEAWDEANGSVLDFFGNLLGFEADITNIGDLMSNMGATVFEVWDGIEEQIIGAITSILAAIDPLAKKLGIDTGFSQARADRLKEERKVARTRTSGRGVAAPAGVQSRGAVRAVEAQQRLADRRRQRAARRAAKGGTEAEQRAAGLIRQTDLGGTGIGRATGRGTAAAVQDVRFGTARAPSAAQPAVTQDNRVELNVTAAPGEDTNALIAKIKTVIDDRDARNRRAVGDALQQTGG